MEDYIIRWISIGLGFIISSLFFPSNMTYLAGILGGMYFVHIQYSQHTIKRSTFFETFTELSNAGEIYTVLIYGVIGLLCVNIITYIISADALWLFAAFVNFFIVYGLFN